MNSMSSDLRATMKLHKPGTHIRRMMNLKNAPSYELVKYLTKKNITEISTPHIHIQHSQFHPPSYILKNHQL